MWPTIQTACRTSISTYCCATVPTSQAVQHNGLLYLTTSEYWGSGAVRMPSIYYAVVQPDQGLCSVSRLEWGLVASQDGLATAYPVIAARKDGSATLAFAYSGAGTIADGTYPAFPGACWDALLTADAIKEARLTPPSTLATPKLASSPTWHGV